MDGCAKLVNAALSENLINISRRKINPENIIINGEK
jgi:hypothetical protein